MYINSPLFCQYSALFQKCTAASSSASSIVLSLDAQGQQVIPIYIELFEPGKGGPPQHSM